jgi:hypothetical protein
MSSDVVHAQILTQLMKTDKMKKKIVFEMPFEVEFLSHKHWLSTWSMALQSKVLVWYMNGFRMAGRSGPKVHEVKLAKRLSCQYPALVRHGLEILSFAWLELIGTRMTSGWFWL